METSIEIAICSVAIAGTGVQEIQESCIMGHLITAGIRRTKDLEIRELKIAPHSAISPHRAIGKITNSYIFYDCRHQSFQQIRSQRGMREALSCDILFHVHHVHCVPTTFLPEQSGINLAGARLPMDVSSSTFVDGPCSTICALAPRDDRVGRLERSVSSRDLARARTGAVS